MKPNNQIFPVMAQKFFLIVFIIISPCFLYANENDRYQELTFKFSKSNLTVKQAFDEISNLPSVDVVFKGSEPFLDLHLTLPSQTISVKEALKIIQEQAPFDIVFNNNHIIVKKRKLKVSYQLKGDVKDAETKEPLVAASVFMPGSARVFLTDINGEFSRQ